MTALPLKFTVASWSWPVHTVTRNCSSPLSSFPAKKFERTKQMVNGHARGLPYLYKFSVIPWSRPALSPEIAVHLCHHFLQKFERTEQMLNGHALCMHMRTALLLQKNTLHQGAHTTTTRQEREIGPLSSTLQKEEHFQLDTDPHPTASS